LKLFSVARETEADVAFADRAEINAWDAANPCAFDQKLSHRP